MAMTEPNHENAVPTTIAAVDEAACALATAPLPPLSSARKKQLAHQSSSSATMTAASNVSMSGSSRDLYDDALHVCQCQPTPAESREFRKVRDTHEMASLRSSLFMWRVLMAYHDVTQV